VATTGSVEITALIRAWGGGDQTALDRLTPLVYDELRRIARRYMRSQGAGHRHALQTTALVHEAYLHLMDAKSANWQDRAHFFAASAQIMRRILIDLARAHASQKRGGGVHHIDHSEAVNLDEIPAPDRSAELLVLDEALTRMEQMDARKAKVIELRFFGGLSVEQAAEVLNVSPQTVMRDWRLARVWLARELRG
jgi:RNA polymerase sigma factor (TIGR02999 family)